MDRQAVDISSGPALHSAANDAPTVLDLISSSDCECTGGVDLTRDASDSDYEAFDSSRSSSLSELKGDELERNLDLLQAEVEASIQVRIDGERSPKSGQGV